MPPDLPGQILRAEQIGTVTAGGACDTRRCHTAIVARDAVPIMPIRKNGRPWKEDCPAARAREDCPEMRARDDTLRATRYHCKAFWNHRTGYHARGRIESRMRRLQALGERIAAGDPDRQTAELHIRIALMNRSNALGTAEIARVA